MKAAPLAWNETTGDPFPVPEEAVYWKARKRLTRSDGSKKSGRAEWVNDPEHGGLLLIPIATRAEELREILGAGRYTLLLADGKGKTIEGGESFVQVGEPSEFGDGESATTGGHCANCAQRDTVINRLLDQNELRSKDMTELAKKLVESQAGLMTSVSSTLNPMGALTMGAIKEARQEAVALVHQRPQEVSGTIDDDEEEEPRPKSSMEQLAELVLPVVKEMAPGLGMIGIELIKKMIANNVTKTVVQTAAAVATEGG